MASVAMAVGVIPEEAAAMTIILAIGVVKMANKKRDYSQASRS